MLRSLDADCREIKHCLKFTDLWYLMVENTKDGFSVLVIEPLLPQDIGSII